MTRYNPPTKVHSIDLQWKSLVVRADPEFELRKRREVTYEFTRRTFIGDNSKSGAYAED